MKNTKTKLSKEELKELPNHFTIILLFKGKEYIVDTKNWQKNKLISIPNEDGSGFILLKPIGALKAQYEDGERINFDILSNNVSLFKEDKFRSLGYNIDDFYNNLRKIGSARNDFFYVVEGAESSFHHKIVVPTGDGFVLLDEECIF